MEGKTLFMIINLFAIINVSLGGLVFQYPHAFELENKNILVIHKFGITLCNPTFTRSISRLKTFSESEQIASDDALTKVSSVKGENYIITIINDKIYIFDKDGNLLFENPDKITENDVEIYTLEYIYEKNDYIYFLIGFVYDTKLYLYAYKYNTNDKSIENFSSLENAASKKIKNNGITCHYMRTKNTNLESDNIITCVYSYDYYQDEEFRIGLEYYDITEASLGKSSNSKYNIKIFGDYTRPIKYIKGSLLPGRQSLLIGWISQNYYPFFWRYDIDIDLDRNIIQSSDYRTQSFLNIKCKHTGHAFHFIYFPDTTDTIFTCFYLETTTTHEDGMPNIWIHSLRPDISEKKQIDKYKDCNITAFSILFFDSISNYVLISDAVCNGKLKPLDTLYSDLPDDEIIIDTESLVQTQKVSTEYLGCEEGEYPKEDFSTDESKNCFKDPEGYYLDNNDEIYRLCYQTCKKCEEKGDILDHKCSECKDDFPIEGKNENNNMKCCKYYYYINSDENIVCTESNSCPESYPKILTDKNQCIQEPSETNKVTENKETDKVTDKEEENKSTNIATENEETNKNSENEQTDKPTNNNQSDQVSTIDTTEEDKMTEKESDFVNKETDAETSSKISGDDTNNIHEAEEVSNCLSLINIESIKNTNDNPSEINNVLYNNIANTLMYNCSNLNLIEATIKGEDDNYFFIGPISNTSNQKLNVYQNQYFSEIDLGQCEAILREEYKIIPNVSLIILISEKLSDIPSERNTQFEIYNPIDNKRLNLSFCDNTTIKISTHVALSEELTNLYNELKESGYDIFNINDKFYTDICSPYKSNRKTDITLADRINYIYNNDETQCQSGCKFVGYNFETQSLNCECSVVESDVDLVKHKNIGVKTLYKSFEDTLKYSNYKVLFCYKLAFNVEIFSYNIGTYFAFGYFLLFFISFIIQKKKGFDELNKNIPQILLNYNQYIDNNDIDNKPIVINQRYMNDFNINNENNENELAHNNKRKSKKLSNRSRKRSSGNLKLSFPPKKKSLTMRKPQKSINNINSLFIINNGENINKYLSRKTSFKLEESPKGTKFQYSNDKIEINNEINIQEKEKEFSHFELNNMEYEDALKYDKRNIFEIYWSILKREHLLIFSLFIRNDNNLIYIKFSRLIFLICTDMCINVFFFSDETMHKMYLDYGKYNLALQISQIIYSTIVTQLLDIFLCFLSLTDKDYYQIKNLKVKDRFVVLKIIKCIKIKLTIFYIFTFIVFAFYWYAITCFCAVYRNTQKAFIINFLSSFALGLLDPFALYSIPSFLRIVSLKCCKGNMGCIYKLSDLIPCF